MHWERAVNLAALFYPHNELPYGNSILPCK